ncbi:MAG: DUF3800 domain-containing protein [Terriglobales bacterium]
MVQAYVDESGGKGHSPVFVFSALLSKAEDWARFSDQWASCLSELPSIRYFKMSEARRAAKGEFYQFSPTERDDKLKRLCSILNALAPTEISCTLNIDVFVEKWGKYPKPFRHPYFFPFLTANFAIGVQVLEMKETEPCEIFFDEHKIFGPCARSWYPIAREFMDSEVLALMPTEPLFRTDLQALPLQAADLTAWMQRARSTVGLGEFSWLDSALAGIHRSDLSQTYDRAWWNRPNTVDQNDPEFIKQTTEALRRGREIFGSEWPPNIKWRNKKTHD